ncbi:MAG: transcription termination factor NusA [Defluviitaleaceae bacterium]|nr:transcription termination factor NusA [Defluviitaleaceae bacterium]
MSNNMELIDALNQIVKEKGIDSEVIFEAIETSLVTACKKHFGSRTNIKVTLDRNTGAVKCFKQRTVVEVLEDSVTEILLEDARQIDSHYEIGDIVDEIAMLKDFGRIAAQTAKQVVVQKFREAEREILYSEFIAKEKEILNGTIQRKEGKNIIIATGKIDAVLAPNEQIAGEEYRFGERVKVYVVEVKQTPKGPMVSVSRTHPDLVKRLFEQEVPEIFEGVVEIKSISREAGSRSKIAVYSKNPDIDAVGACVGQNGYRVNLIVAELGGEKVDIINWSDEPHEFIAAALSPSKVIAVIPDMETGSSTVVVPNHQLSLAIGKEGQNARLAAKLTGWKIDIKSESQAEEEGFFSTTQFAEMFDETGYTEGEHYEEDEYYEGEYYDEEHYEDEYVDDEIIDEEDNKENS